jgi:hypothetical protein
MRKLLTASLAALSIGFATPSLRAAPAGGAIAPNATPLTRFAQGDYYGNHGYGFGWGTGYNYIPACPSNYHYACWHDPYGYRHCGCILNWW